MAKSATKRGRSQEWLRYKVANRDRIVDQVVMGVKAERKGAGSR
jgi:hypothetical protein